MRKDLLIPQVTGYHAAGEPNYLTDELVEYSKKKVRDILCNHKPPMLDSETAAKVSRAAKKHGIDFSKLGPGYAKMK
jgi:hypothetical protein